MRMYMIEHMNSRPNEILDGHFEAWIHWGVILVPSLQIFIERQIVEQPDIPNNFTAFISNTVFRNNSCHESGALHIRSAAHTIGPNVTFDSNAATGAWGRGGALGLHGLVSLRQLPP